MNKTFTYWRPDEPVDGANLPLAEHVERIAADVPARACSSLASEIRNALVPVNMLLQSKQREIEKRYEGTSSFPAGDPEWADTESMLKALERVFALAGAFSKRANEQGYLNDDRMLAEAFVRRFNIDLHSVEEGDTDIMTILRHLRGSR